MKAVKQFDFGADGEASVRIQEVSDGPRYRYLPGQSSQLCHIYIYIYDGFVFVKASNVPFHALAVDGGHLWALYVAFRAPALALRVGEAGTFS